MKGLLPGGSDTQTGREVRQRGGGGGVPDPDARERNRTEAAGLPSCWGHVAVGAEGSQGAV